MKLQIGRSGRFYAFAVIIMFALILTRRDSASIRETLKNGLIVTAAALLHELGHMMAACALGTSIARLRLDVFGARLHLSGMMSYRCEAVIAAAGPAANLFSAALIFPVWRHAGSPEDGLLVLFQIVSVGLAVVNLLPVRTMDGGRILRCLLAPLAGDRFADGVLSVTTVLILGLLWFFSVYALLRVGEMLTLFAFSLALLGRLLGRD